MRLPVPMLLALLAAPCLAQEADTLERLEACTAGVDMEAIGRRADAFADARGYEARVAELCAAGDRAGADAFAKEVAAAFYAEDLDAGRMRACMAGVLGEDVDATPACD